jgi:hypothetical protein
VLHVSFVKSCSFSNARVGGCWGRKRWRSLTMKCRYACTEINWLTPWSRVFLDFRRCSSTPQFMELEISLSCLQEPTTCTCPEPAESSPRYNALFFNSHFNIIIRCWLGLSSGLFPPCFLAYILNEFFFSPARYVSHPSHLPWYCLVKNKPRSCLLCTFFYSPVTSPHPARPPQAQISFIRILFSNTLNVRDQVLQSYKTAGRVRFLCILIFMFLIAEG